jgi:hypothetical protein
MDSLSQQFLYLFGSFVTLTALVLSLGLKLHDVSE